MSAPSSNESAVVPERTPLTLLLKLRDRSDNLAWSRFVRLYTPLLFKWVAKASFQSAEAEDVVQNILLGLWTALPQFDYDPNRRFRSWLYTVVRSRCEDFRRRKATRKLPGDTGLDGHPSSESYSEPDEREYASILTRQALALIKPEIKPETWAAFSALMLDGKPAEEVAKKQDMSVNAVYLCRHRVLKRLREELDGLLD